MSKSPESMLTVERGKTDQNVQRTLKARRKKWFEPLGSIPHRHYVVLATCGILMFLLVWALLTYTGFIDKLFLPTPTDILNNGVVLFSQFQFATDILATVYRVLVGFALASLVAVPVGIAMGVFRPVEAFLEPLVSFARYLPASAFIPLLILWIGIGNTEKIAVIFLGSVFSIVLMVAVHVHHTRRELLEAAYTLGAKNWFILRYVIVPSTLPDIFDTLRLVLGWAWTYIIVAELVAADSGIGYVILQSQRMLQTGNIIFGIVVIGVIGLITDFLMKWVGNTLFRWRDSR